jgi:lipopolysaccharide biosynthesis glycosyltransferase
VEKDLGQLWEQQIESFPALAVSNYNPLFIGYKKDENYILFGLPPDTPYCNTGVMVMNLNRWRAEKIGSRALELACRFPLTEADQEALNIIIAGSWGLLDPKWNVQLSGVEEYACFLKQFSNLSNLEMQQTRDELLRDSYIIHFTWRVKPWHFVYKKSARSRFFYYLKWLVRRYRGY